MWTTVTLQTNSLYSWFTFIVQPQDIWVHTQQQLPSHTLTEITTAAHDWARAGAVPNIKQQVYWFLIYLITQHIAMIEWLMLNTVLQVMYNKADMNYFQEPSWHVPLFKKGSMETKKNLTQNSQDAWPIFKWCNPPNTGQKHSCWTQLTHSWSTTVIATWKSEKSPS